MEHEKNRELMLPVLFLFICFVITAFLVSRENNIVPLTDCFLARTSDREI